MAEDKWRIEVDRGSCIGSGMCTGTAPDHFALVEGKSSAIHEYAEPDDAVLGAAESCPAEAIRVWAANGTVLAPEV
ncbi:ferredoxin [Nocardia terpenica]|uniref:Ferredoxin n=1 Tax=Nocardia terpenica TaxID=455432 RepID=A0A6G9Z8S2_9NOCA|nr:ferredoxin [Nocardia terpenica]QIS21999.1 ferredoxin [Nocardia terpenica]